jgi:hypothetical protein
MSVEQLIAEFKALPWAERRRVADAILSNEALHVSEKPSAIKESAHKPLFSERWSGRFTLPEPDQDDARLTYLLDRFST